MRNATILVYRLRGIATEAIKNIVLAGIGKLIVVDTEDVSEEDLGAGFFFRDEDVGKKVRKGCSTFVLAIVSYAPSCPYYHTPGARSCGGAKRSA